MGPGMGWGSGSHGLTLRLRSLTDFDNPDVGSREALASTRGSGVLEGRKVEMTDQRLCL